MSMWPFYLSIKCFKVSIIKTKKHSIVCERVKLFLIFFCISVCKYCQHFRYMLVLTNVTCSLFIYFSDSRCFLIFCLLTKFTNSKQNLNPLNAFIINTFLQHCHMIYFRFSLSYALLHMPC